MNKKVATAAAKSLQSCPTLCDPVDGSPPGSPVPGILQARTLEKSMDCIVHGVAMSQTRLSGFHFHFSFQANTGD